MKITDLTNYSTPDDSDVLPIVDLANNTTKKITRANLFKTPPIADGAIIPKMLAAGAGSTWATTTWSPSFSGFSPDPSGGLYYYIQQGKLVTCFIRMPNTGTSNGTGFTITAPLTSRTITNMLWTAQVTVVDNSVVQTTPGLIYIPSNSSTFTVVKNSAGGAGSWTASGGKGVSWGTITYEVA